MIKMIVGPPASGKTSISKKYVDQRFIHLNRDTEGGKVIDLLPKMESLLKDKKSIIIDNLFATAESRKPFIDLAKKYDKIDCLLMETSIEDATFNAIQRMIDIHGSFPSLDEIKKSKHPNIFPVAVLFKFKKEYQKPSLTEGFDSIEKIPFLRKDKVEFKNKALFLDYDSTIRECVGGNGKFPTEESHISILPNRYNILKSFQDNGYYLIGVSNQSGVHKGDLTFNKAYDLFVHTNKLLGLDIEINFCPHQSAPPVCYCRKPQIGIFVNMMNKFKLNRAECLFVGDHGTDASAAKRFGIKYVDQAEFFK